MPDKSICMCCGSTDRRRRVRAGDIWQGKFRNSEGLRVPSVRIISPEKDGAIVEQIGREEIDGRFGMSYRELAGGFEPSHAPASSEEEN